MAVNNDSIPKIEYNNGVTDVTIEFELPPATLDYEGRQYRAIEKVSESTNGNYATSSNYIEEQRNLEFKQVKQSIIDQLETFFLTHAMLGNSFKYFVNKDEATFQTVQLRRGQRKFRPQRTGWNNDNEFTYKFKISMRQVV